MTWPETARETCKIRSQNDLDLQSYASSIRRSRLRRCKSRMPRYSVRSRFNSQRDRRTLQRSNARYNRSRERPNDRQPRISARARARGSQLGFSINSVGLCVPAGNENNSINARIVKRRVTRLLKRTIDLYLVEITRVPARIPVESTSGTKIFPTCVKRCVYIAPQTHFAGRRDGRVKRLAWFRQEYTTWNNGDAILKYKRTCEYVTAVYLHSREKRLTMLSYILQNELLTAGACDKTVTEYANYRLNFSRGGLRLAM